MKKDEVNEAGVFDLVGKFWRGYRVKPADVSDLQWLEGQFAEYPELWLDEQERRAAAADVVEGVTGYRQSAEREAACHAEGKSSARFLQETISTAAKAQGVASTAAYAADIEHAIQGANDLMARTVFMRHPDGTIDYTHVNQCPHLNGNIAEAHHAATYNIDAAVKESDLHAEVPASYGNNSVDILIKDGNGHTVGRYQSKYGQGAKATQTMYENGDYRGQRKLVPEEQSADVPGSTDRVKAGGVESTPLTKEDARKMQRDAQKSGKPSEYDWNNANAGVVMKAIGKRACWAGALAIGFQGVRILGRRIWNEVTGKPNQSVEEDLHEFVDSAVKSGASAAGTVAVAGGLTVAAKKGLLGTVMKSVKGNVIANVACVAVENLKILGDVGRGKITGREALDRVGRANCALVGSLAAAGKGMGIGATIGAVFGPVGIAVGGVIGGIAGGVVGSTVGEIVYAGAKTVCASVCKVVSSCISAMGKVIGGIARVLNPFAW